MRIVKPSTLREFWQCYPHAQAALIRWREVVNAAQWESIADVRRTLPHADLVTVRSGRVVVVFNIAGNHYRLIAAIHYNKRVVYVLKILTHSEYSADRWKEKL